jgi:hypothetical protein
VSSGLAFQPSARRICAGTLAGLRFRNRRLREQGDVIAAGFPEFWRPVYHKYRGFFDCALKLAPIVSDMVKTPVGGQLLHIVGRLVGAAANSYGALLTLVLNGYGLDAMKIARSIYETELNNSLAKESSGRFSGLSRL